MHCGTRTPEFGGNYVELLFLPWKPKFCCTRGAPISRRFAPLLSRCRVDQLCDSDDVRAMPLTASVTVTRSGNELATAGNELATSPVAIVTVVSTLAIVSSARRRPAPPDRHCSQGEMARANLHRCRSGRRCRSDVRRAGQRDGGDAGLGVPLPVAAVLDELSERSVAPAGTAVVGVTRPCRPASPSVRPAGDGDVR